jgi:hypothetical protein
VIDTRRLRDICDPIVAVWFALLPAAPVERANESSSFCSLLVTQCRTRTQNKISALQHMRQIQPGSPLRTIRIVRLTTDVVSVAHEPTKERKAMRLRTGLEFVW